MQEKTTRILALELAKGFAIIFMIFVHVNEICWENLVFNNSFETFIHNLIEFLGGGPSAPVFMVCMGVGYAYSKKAQSKFLLKRAEILALLAVFVNFVQQWIPILFRDNMAEGFAEFAPAIIATDIYSFAAVSMLFFAIIMKFDEKLRIKACIISIFVFAIAKALLSPVIHATGNAWVDVIIGIFFRVNEFSYFPFFTWVNFPLIGFIVGSWYKESKNKKKFQAFLFIIGVIMLIASGLYMENTGMSNSIKFAATDVIDAYYSMSIPNILFALGVVICSFILCDLISKINCIGKIKQFLCYMSKHIMEIYVAQWTFIGLATYVLDRVTSVYCSMLCSLGIMLLSIAAVAYYDKIKEKHNTKKLEDNKAIKAE